MLFWWHVWSWDKLLAHIAAPYCKHLTVTSFSADFCARACKLYSSYHLVLSDIGLLKKSRDLEEWSEADAWKDVEDQKYFTRGDASILKHNAALKESGFTVTHKMAVCEELRHREIYFQLSGSGLKLNSLKSGSRRFERIFLAKNFFRVMTIEMFRTSLSINISLVRTVLTALPERPWIHCHRRFSWKNLRRKRSYFG